VRPIVLFTLLLVVIVVHADKMSIVGTWIVRTSTDHGKQYVEHYTFLENGTFQIIVIERDLDQETTYRLLGKWEMDGDRLDFRITCSNHPRIPEGKEEVNLIISLSQSEVVTRGSDGRISAAIRAGYDLPVVDKCS
jgi:hypothetical protein